MKKTLSVCCCLALFFSLWAMPARAAKNDVRGLLNAAPLSPLKTGCESLDQQIGEILGQITTDNMTTFEKTVAAFDYCVKNFTYESNEIVLSYDLLARYLVRDDAVRVAQAETMLRTRHGVCNDFAALFMVFTRAIGLESYQVGGKVRAAGGGMTGHQWDVIRLKGKYYLFDAQLENQYYVRDGAMTYDFFGIPLEEADWYDLSGMDTYIDGFGEFRQAEINVTFSFLPSEELPLLPDEPLRISIGDVSANVPVTEIRFYYLNENVSGFPMNTPMRTGPGPDLYLPSWDAGDWTVFVRANTDAGSVLVRELHYRRLNAEELTVIPGDVDTDGRVTSADARLSLRAAVGLVTVSGSYTRFVIMDVDTDGNLTAADARLILRASVGLEKLDGRADTNAGT